MSVHCQITKLTFFCKCYDWCYVTCWHDSLCHLPFFGTCASWCYTLDSDHPLPPRINTHCTSNNSVGSRGFHGMPFLLQDCSFRLKQNKYVALAALQWGFKHFKSRAGPVRVIAFINRRNTIFSNAVHNYIRKPLIKVFVKNSIWSVW